MLWTDGLFRPGSTQLAAVGQGGPTQASCPVAVPGSKAPIFRSQSWFRLAFNQRNCSVWWESELCGDIGW